jgi:hypothetical protein
MKKIFFIVFSLFFTNLAISQEAYICLPSKKTGYIFNVSSKSWEQANFKTNEEKKILKKNGMKWEWRIFGEKHGYSDCGGDGFGKGDDFNSAGFIFCSIIGGHVRMNKNSLRYIETYEIGFIDGKDQSGNTPLIEIGTCSPL